MRQRVDLVQVRCGANPTGTCTLFARTTPRAQLVYPRPALSDEDLAVVTSVQCVCGAGRGLAQYQAALSLAQLGAPTCRYALDIARQALCTLARTHNGPTVAQFLTQLAPHFSNVGVWFEVIVPLKKGHVL